MYMCKSRNKNSKAIYEKTAVIKPAKTLVTNVHARVHVHISTHILHKQISIKILRKVKQGNISIIFLRKLATSGRI